MNQFKDVDHEAVALWSKWLRDESMVQVQGALVANLGLDEGDTVRPYGVCALGAGMLAMGADPHTLTGGAESKDFVDWLGGGAFWDRDSTLKWPVTVCIDWPEGLTTPAPWKDMSYASDPALVTVVGLNDMAGLTLPQIADCIDYFGIVLR